MTGNRHPANKIARFSPSLSKQPEFFPTFYISHNLKQTKLKLSVGKKEKFFEMSARHEFNINEIIKLAKEKKNSLVQ